MEKAEAPVENSDEDFDDEMDDVGELDTVQAPSQALPSSSVGAKL